MQIPDSARNSQLLRPISESAWCFSKPSAMAQVKTTITDVRIAVARFESMPDTPTLARSAVAAAKTAESNAQKTQVMHLRIRCLTLAPRGGKSFVAINESESGALQINRLPLAALDSGSDLGWRLALLCLLISVDDLTHTGRADSSMRALKATVQTVVA